MRDVTLAEDSLGVGLRADNDDGVRISSEREGRGEKQGRDVKRTNEFRGDGSCVIGEDSRDDGRSTLGLGDRGEEEDGCWERKEESLGGGEEDVPEGTVSEGEAFVGSLED